MLWKLLSLPNLAVKFLVTTLFYYCYSKNKLGEAAATWAALVPSAKVCGLQSVLKTLNRVLCSHARITGYFGTDGLGEVLFLDLPCAF